MAAPSGARQRGRVSRQAIVAKALEIADREGLEQVSFRRLAGALDLTPMALYTHVRDKSDLLNAMADVVLGEIAIPALGGRWTDMLRATLRAAYSAFENHRSAGVLIARPLVSPAAMRLTETLLQVLQLGGFSATESVKLIQVLTGMILGPVVLASGYGRLAGQGSQTSAKGDASYDNFVQRLSAGEYPVLLSVLPAVLEWPSPTDLSDAAVDLLVEGLAALAARRSTTV
jgi:AcrR family transcriptional regulator